MANAPLQAASAKAPPRQQKTAGSSTPEQQAQLQREREKQDRRRRRRCNGLAASLCTFACAAAVSGIVGLVVSLTRRRGMRGMRGVTALLRRCHAARAFELRRLQADHDAELALRQRQLEAAEQKLADRGASLGEAERLRAAAAAEVQAVKGKIKSQLQQRNHAAVVELQQEQAAKEQRLRELEGHVTEAESQRDKAVGELELAVAELESLRASRVDSAAYARFLESKVSELEQQGDAVVLKQRDEARAELTALREQLEQAAGAAQRHAEAKAALKAARGELEVLKARAKAEAKQLVQLQQQLQQAAGAARQQARAVAALKAARAEVEVLKARAEAEAKHVAKLQQQLEQHDEAKAALQAATAEVDGLKARAEAEAQRVAELQKQLQQLEEATVELAQLRRNAKAEALQPSSIEKTISDHLALSADKEELSKRVKALLLLWHPDKHRVLPGLANEVTKIINSQWDERKKKMRS